MHAPPPPKQTTATSIAPIIRAALLPFALSLLVMTYGCPLGIPGRLPFDAINVALLLSYAASVHRILEGTATRLHPFGLSRIQFPRFRADAARALLAVSVRVLIPGCLLLAVWVLGLKPFIADINTIVVTVASRVLPMYGLVAVWAVFTHRALAARRPVA